MTPEEFVEGLTVNCRAAAAGVVSLLEAPPGRKPSRRLVELAAWYKALSGHDQKMLRQVVELAAGQSLFGVLCALDGVSSVFHGAPVELRLIATRDNVTTVVSPSATYLHDIYASAI